MADLTPFDRFCAGTAIQVTGVPGAPPVLVRERVRFGTPQTFRFTVGDVTRPGNPTMPVTAAAALRWAWTRAQADPPNAPWTFRTRLARFLGDDWPVVEALLAAEVPA